MDREFEPLPSIHPEAEDVGEAADLGIKDVGMSVPFGIAAQNVEGVAAKIRSGAGNLELGFPGAVRGNRQSHTPGMWGLEQREALRELAKANEVRFTTHASYGIPGLAGQDQQGNFSDEQRKMVVDEVRRAIEFAKDTAGGGSVVVHTGEFTRPISEQPWAKSSDEQYRFKQFHDEPERAIIRLVDKRTGQVLQQIRKNQEVARARWMRADRDYDHVVTEDKDFVLNGHSLHQGEKVRVKKGQYIDYEGNPVNLDNRVPVYNRKTGWFEIDVNTWDDFEKEARELNEERARSKGMNYNQFMRESDPEDIITPEEAFLHATTRTQEMVAKGWAGSYARGLDDSFDLVERLKKARDFYKDVESKLPPDQRYKVKEMDSPMTHDPVINRFLSSEDGDDKLPSELLEKAIDKQRKELWSYKEMVTGQLQQAKEQQILRENVTTPEKFALSRSYDSYADAAMYAMDNSKDPNNPIVITLENIFPESYGAHPEELHNLITKSREKMAERLQQERGINKPYAEKVAAQHIKATLDTGHLNMWRKFWQEDKDKSKDQNNKEFNKWMLENVEKLAKDGYIGNVHLTDNYGYQDDHLAPGQGNAPVKDITKILKKHGYSGAWTVEPGADATTDQGDVHGLMKTWRYFGTPIYGIDTAPGVGAPDRSFTDVSHSYFGYTASPYFIHPPYAPSNDWSLWSQVQME
ncbi:sugar phosphate isomerase/epimerase [Candidatus Woesearchaeota archaeon]|nr:sugar phosphate isomerase/epimerase [Candidatus Woesearchaeota archaeon]